MQCVSDQSEEGDRSVEVGASGPAAVHAEQTVHPRGMRVLDRLLVAHETWFDVERDHELAGRVFPGYAEFHSQGERYVLSKRAKLWEVANHEYLFFDVVGRLDGESYGRMISFMKTEALGIVRPMPNHMSSNISLVVLADKVTPEVRGLVRRTRFRKNFRLGFWGWSDLRVAVVDLAGTAPDGRRRVMTNAAGKALRKVIEANLALETGSADGSRSEE